MYLAFATRSTGFPQLSLEPDDLTQPQLLEFAGVLCDDRDNEVDRLTTLVRPDPEGMITESTFERHGVLIEEAFHCGIEPSRVIHWFVTRAKAANRLVGFNLHRDIENMRIATARYADQRWEPETAIFCTMVHAASRLNLPPSEQMCAAGQFHPRMPTLDEASDLLLGEPMPHPLDASAQVRTSLRLFRQQRRIHLVA